MKKILAILLAVLMILSAVACGKADPSNGGQNTDNPSGGEEQQVDDPDENNQGENQNDNDPDENNQGENGNQSSDNHEDYDPNYWADLYGASICPFNITFSVAGADYYFRGGGDLRDWVYTENNIDNWYYYNDMVISYDNKYAIGPEIESLSSYCTYEATAYDGPTLTEEEQKEIKNGILYVLNSYTPIKTNLGIDLKAAEDERDTFLACRDICSEFKKGESINLYAELDNQEDMEVNAALYVLPHVGGGYKLEKISDELKEQAVANSKIDKTEAEEPKASFEISEEAFANSESGRFDIVLTYDEYIVGYVVIHVE